MQTVVSYGFSLFGPTQVGCPKNGKCCRKGSSLKKNLRGRICPMPAGARQDITELLTAWGEGDEDALKRLMPVVYQELRRIARKHLTGQSPEHTLESAALVNEAYLKLIRADGIRCE